MNTSLQGKTAWVGGASQGIGRATAIALARLGATVYLAARSADDLADVQARLDTEHGQRHRHFAIDYDDTDALRQLAEQVAADTPVHICINNTGGPKGGPIAAAATDEFEAAMQRHVIANHVLMQAFYPGMKAADYGRIVNVLSTSVKQPIPGLGVSNTTRAAVANWAKTLAGELGQHGITVNNVLPGFTDTGRLAQIIDSKAARLGQSREQVIATMQGGVPMRRFARPEEVANGIAFLCSPAASYINGINLPVDGGRTGSL